MKLDQTLVAYRFWPKAHSVLAAVNDTRHRTDPHRLYPWAYGRTPWIPGENVAVCFSCGYDSDKNCDARKIPKKNCGCGLHALPRLKRAIEVGGPESEVGAVVMYGKLRCGGEHIRASHAEVIALLRRSKHTPAIAAHYGVPMVESHEMLRAVALEHGAELTEDQIKDLFPRGWRASGWYELLRFLIDR